jgi:protoporphyrinogen oxidase
VAILGAGPAGVGAAFQLTRLGRGQATVLERHARAGGLAGSFVLGGHQVDFGSHRLHPSCDPAILADIRTLLGDDLLDRPRHGRIRLRGRWIHFPLKPLDLALRLPPTFALGVAGDLVRKVLPSGQNGTDHATFASVLQRGLGATVCRDFYFPYARKIWGLQPEELSDIQARRRVRAGSIGKVLKKVLSAVPLLKPRGGGRFYYPRGGFGQIVRGFYEAACAQGSEFCFGATVEEVRLPYGAVGMNGANGTANATVAYRVGNRPATLDAEHIWSTIPITALVQLLRPQAPPVVLDAVKAIRYRSMMLIYLVIGQPRFSEYDAHYFPETEVPITRLSEPRNYSTAVEPAERTVLCAELPCAEGDAHWKMSDQDLGRLVQDALARLGIPIRGPVLDVATRRLTQAYPIYQSGYEAAFGKIDAWLNGLPNIVTLGRQGLFAHDNTHHTLAMAYAAVACLDESGRFDRHRWGEYRRRFESHVVED